jgi:hypothetical protein
LKKPHFRKTHPSKIQNRRRVRFCRMNLKQEKSKIMQNEFETEMNEFEMNQKKIFWIIFCVFFSGFN